MNLWSNYSDLTRPHPKWWFSKGNLLFQGNFGWWIIINWPDEWLDEQAFRFEPWNFWELELEVLWEERWATVLLSHVDLSEESLEDNISICKKYLERMAKINLLLEMELGVTGGEEDALSLEMINTEFLFNPNPQTWMISEWWNIDNVTMFLRFS